MNGLPLDLGSAWRSLCRSPAYALTAVALLGIGLGAGATIWTAYEAVVLRPLPYPEPDRLVTVLDVDRGVRSTISPSNFADYRAEAKSLSALAAYLETSVSFTDGRQRAEQIESARVSADFFSLLGSTPTVGRLLTAEDEAVGSRSVVLSHGLWIRRFGADRGIVGASVRLDGETRTVVGVAPRGFRFPSGAELWTPLAFTPQQLESQRGAHYLDAVGRLAPGATLDELTAELERIGSRLAEEHPRTNRGVSATAEPLARTVVGDASGTLGLLLGAVALTLAAACANLASVALARSLARRRDFALRASLGASPQRLLGERLAESLLVATAGAVVGAAVAALALKTLPALAPNLPRIDQARFGLPAIAAAAAIAGLAALAVGLAPALFAARRAPIEALHAGGPTVAGTRDAGRLRRGLVVATTALAFVLVAGAALVARSAERVASVEPGFRAEGLLSFRVSLPDATYPTAEDNASFVAALLERLRALPGVEAAHATFGAPFSGFSYSISVHSIDGVELPDPQGAPEPEIRVVTPGWFRDLGVPVTAGRELTADDRHGAPPAVVVSELAARRIFEGADPRGRRLTLGTSFGLGRGRAGGEVVGVVGDVRDQRLDREPRPTVYLSYDQFPLGYITFVVAAAPARLEGLVEPVHRTVSTLDPGVPLFRVRSVESLIAETTARRRLVVRLLGGFAVLTTALAALGLFGVLAATVVERHRELAVRGALGAAPSELVRLVVGDGLRLTLLGLAAGAALAWPLARLLRGELYELSAHDPATLATAALVLLGLALLTAALPARRAARLDPIRVLREDG